MSNVIPIGRATGDVSLELEHVAQELIEARRDVLVKDSRFSHIRDSLIEHGFTVQLGKRAGQPSTKMGRSRRVHDLLDTAEARRCARDHRDAVRERYDEALRRLGEDYPEQLAKMGERARYAETDPILPTLEAKDRLWFGPDLRRARR